MKHSSGLLSCNWIHVPELTTRGCQRDHSFENHWFRLLNFFELTGMWKKMHLFNMFLTNCFFYSTLELLSTVVFVWGLRHWDPPTPSGCQWEQQAQLMWLKNIQQFENLHCFILFLESLSCHKILICNILPTQGLWRTYCSFIGQLFPVEKAWFTAGESSDCDSNGKNNQNNIW